MTLLRHDHDALLKGRSFLAKPGHVLSDSSAPVSFDDLHRTYRASLLRYFSRRVAESAAAEDMVQQVFERLLRRGDIESIDNLEGYVFQTARSVITDHLRHRSSRHSHAHESFEEAVHGGVDFSPEHVLAKRERLARAVQLLQALPERTRVIFVLRRLEGVKYRDIADRLGISVSAVEKHMERAVLHLAKGLEEGS
jgi:RNA polymerase sigma factor (sigma-70 family)